MVEPNDILYVDGPLPLVGSKLGSAEREAIAAAIIRVCQKKKEWIKVRDIISELNGMAIFHLHPEECNEALFEMIDERLFFKGKDKLGIYLRVTPKLLRLLITSTYSSQSTYPNAAKLLQDIKIGLPKKANT